MKLATGFAVAVLTFASATAGAYNTGSADDTPSAGAMAVDLLLVRPIALVGSVVGIGLFVLQLPLDVLQAEWPREPAQKLVVEPLRYTFTRKLGRMDYNTSR